MDVLSSSVNPRSVAARSRSAKERAWDELVMQTNSSSIVSKRSVERIYYPDEPHYFRYFVNKFQRRAPLINRGYHLRLHIIDSAVRRFLERPGHDSHDAKTKVVVNLGCGSDVLPWQCMARYPDACHGAKFIDIDFPDLMAKKRAVVLNTPELCSVFGPFDVGAGEHVLLQSDKYSQIGCDLRDTADIQKALSICLGLSDCVFMFVAEVSITYMETSGADRVIKWASSLGQAEFCLLEQILPDGSDHPFAETMLRHFDKLKTPLKSVHEYPSLEDQNRRFSRLGWLHVKTLSLWQVWINDEWVSASQRRALDLVEPFDEWEEFALFAGHYCVVLARNHHLDSVCSENGRVVVAERLPPQLCPRLLFHAYSGTRGRRRFGAALQTRDELGQQVFANTFGLGTNDRLKSCDLYSFDSLAEGIRPNSAGPSRRVCHAIADLGQFGSLLTGGRTSPTSALRDCWRFSTDQNRWSPSDSLPLPLYRHAVAQLGRSNMTILVGGKSDSSTIFPGCLMHRPASGWTECSISSSVYQPVCGAILIGFKTHHLIESDSESPILQFEGILAGGLKEDGTFGTQVLRWRLEVPPEGKPTISFEPMISSANAESLVCRFGASAHLLDGERVAVVGGIQHDGVVSRRNEVIILNVSKLRLDVVSCCSLASSDEPSSTTPRPVLVGTAVSLAEHDRLLVMGGGATCFSMGTYWNQGCYVLFMGSLHPRSSPAMTSSPLIFRKLVEVADQPQLTKQVFESSIGSQRANTISDVPRIRISTADEFENVLKAGKPVILEGCGLGTCVHKWNPAYLTKHVGPQRRVVVHEASSPTMDFNSKNFSYTTKSFASFLAEVEKGAKQYLRALSEEHPTDQPANVKADFPDLADDFQLPPALSLVKRNEFSSVLRISGRVNMWLHYDVMANVYCQVVGSKRLLLFPPDDVGYLSLVPGASTSSIDVFSGLETPALASTHPHEAILGPGDILFLPPLWLHATTALTDLGVAINVFFRSLETGYSNGRDVYGNRDVAAYEKGRQDVARIMNSLGKLPRDMQAFYMRRLADEMAEMVIR
ncbi:leucine carboxyl methyltransferase [Nemania sp. NC0429]|nr:leucine carboxyl methyltransferase [Nemania sp. NC0429]